MPLNLPQPWPDFIQHSCLLSVVLYHRQAIEIFKQSSCLRDCFDDMCRHKSTFAWKTTCQLYFVSDPFPKKRSDHESQKSGFRFDMKNPLEVWILWIHDPFLDFSNKTQNPFSDSRKWIWIFPKNAP